MNEDLRNYMEILEFYSGDMMPDEVLVEDDRKIDDNTIIVSDLTDIVEKLRSYSETSSNEDYALGFESGLEMAATLIDNLIKTVGVSSGS